LPVTRGIYIAGEPGAPRTAANATTFPLVPPPSRSAGPRYCIVMLSAVGDAVHVLPVVNAIKRADPTSHITWVLQPGPASLVEGHPSVDEIVRFDRSRGWRAFLDVRNALHSQRFDVVLGLQDYLKAGILTAMAPAPVKLGYDHARARDANWLFTNRRIPPHEPQHIQDEYLEFTTALGIDSTVVEWNIGPWGAEREWQREFVKQFERPIVSLVIGTSRTQKDWIAERWGELADALSGRFGLQPVLVGGRSTREEATERLILERTRHKPVSALNSGLRRLVAILDASALVISLDTGPLHMAVALERPVISLLGFSNPLRTGPYRASHELIVNAYGDMWNGARVATDRRMDRMQKITVADVLAKVAIWKERYADGCARSAPNS
jgi:heptosyltransferase I